MTKNKNIELNFDWNYKLYKNYKSLPLPGELLKNIKRFTKTNLPSTILNDLLKNKIIPDPFYSDNERLSGWVSECDWIYKKVFNADDLSYNQLVFEGIDTISEIWFNGKLLGKTDNMFVEYTFNLSGLLKKKKNELKVVLFSPVNYAKKEEAKHGKLSVALDSTRAYIRKAQYSFGWDWGPTLPNAGIWKNVYLKKADEISIKDFSFKTISIKNNSAKVEVQFECSELKTKNYNYSVIIKLDGEILSKSGKCVKGSNKIKLEIPKPKLWYPNGMGEQNLYALDLNILNDSNEKIFNLSKQVGIRTVELRLKEKNEKTFKFIINNEPSYIKGANWIPIDSLLDRGTDKKYQKLISLAAKANMNMLRVWGGGIYEKDIFYELCDKYGLLVWQDFMFACGSYPEHEEYLQNVENEVNQNVERIRNHSCIALWCGNNENEWIWTQENFTSYKEMPGYNIYHKVIPGILKEKNITEPYWPSSPFGSDKDPNSQTSGNRHQWYIWSFWKDYKTVVEDNSLFVSEFGFQGAANRDTLEAVIPKSERNIQGEIVEHHNKQVEGQERVIRFLSAHLPLKTNWEDFIYLSQLNQGLALKTCLDHWRTNEKTFGSIIWQINDVWPVISWSLVDSDTNPKMSYNFVKDSFNSIMSTVTCRDKVISVKINNDGQRVFTGYLEIGITELSGGKTKLLKVIPLKFKGSKIVNLPPVKMDMNNSLLTSTVYSNKKVLLHRSFYLKKEWKHARLTKARVVFKHDKENKSVIIKTKKAIIFGDLYLKGFVFEERGFILLGNEIIAIKYKSTSGKELELSKLKLFSLNNYLSL